MKVSVVIPVYNAEKYLGMCLKSILIQTLTDFEVIVVDDCSTDSSLAVAESYVERFGGRLKIIKLEKNTGSGSVPRNVGLEHARGKYVFFADADDFVLDNALETLYNFAEDYRAEMVCMEKFFMCNGEPIPKNLSLSTWCYKDSLIEEPTFESDNLIERIKKFLDCKFHWPPWAKFLRRDLLIAEDIKFPHMKISEDIPWTFKLVCLTKRWLYVPSPLYVSRTNPHSMTRRFRSPEQAITFWSNPLIIGVECMDEFMGRIEYFKQNPDIRLQVLNLFVNIHFNHMADALKVLDTTEVYEIFLREFSKASSTQPALIAYLLTINNLYRNELIK